MPIKDCKVDGKPGKKWGSAGKCYVGPNSKKLAIKNGLAIEGPKKFAEIMKANAEDYSDILTDPETTDSEVQDILSISSMSAMEQASIWVSRAAKIATKPK